MDKVLLMPAYDEKDREYILGLDFCELLAAIGMAKTTKETMIGHMAVNAWIGYEGHMTYAIRPDVLGGADEDWYEVIKYGEPKLARVGTFCEAFEVDKRTPIDTIRVERIYADQYRDDYKIVATLFDGARITGTLSTAQLDGIKEVEAASKEG